MVKTVGHRALVLLMHQSCKTQDTRCDLVSAHQFPSDPGDADP